MCPRVGFGLVAFRGAPRGTERVLTGVKGGVSIVTKVFSRAVLRLENYSNARVSERPFYITMSVRRELTGGRGVALSSLTKRGLVLVREK